ncbi:YgiQ family radical SAM protein [Candidatus Termititenax persephonae]|uniref:YgiQ family radical SAM protein n=1 Tax=Candidatus Termititenax persephonae TaxID=2218525 RepID=A0A388TGY9_9BACT|nr:YgiQ family radical SAM protein [Candidatus Termititenax persephonae]
MTEARELGWDTLDVILVSGDAYVDHPSFGTALIGRYLEAHGFKVGIIPQPDWKNPQSIAVLGRPNLFFCVSAGNIDSLVNNYTADKKPRRTDMYSPDNEAGHRPDRASIVYTSLLKQVYKNVPVVLGGVEASLRRFVHYDYWDDKPRRSLLLDSKADLLLYGMSEKATLCIAEHLRAGNQWADLPQPPNSTQAHKTLAAVPADRLVLPAAETALQDKKIFAEHFASYFREGRKKKPRVIVEPYPDRFLVTTPPDNLTGREVDALFFLPFARAPHPRYQAQKIPCYDFVRFSTITHRGCFGGCAFCAISQHQGRQIISRTEESILQELREIISPDKDFQGTVFDLGGPTANMYGMSCRSSQECLKNSCLYPKICPHLQATHARQKALLSRARKLPGIKKILLNSGIRYDLALLDPEYLGLLFTHHVGGQLSLAPEHICENVLAVMGKPSYHLYVKFLNKFLAFNREHHVQQYIVPYFISAHPGCTLSDALQLALYLHEHHLRLEQAQNFTPTPMTAATTMYYTGLDPFTKKPIHVPKGEERAFQKALLQPHLPKNYRQVAKALKLLQREDLLKTLTQA